MFQPMGGAVDVIVVQQEDGSYKSAPWYVRFGKFQGILKRREKVVTLVVNDVVADFHMYLDAEGEAYFVKEEDISDSPKLLEGEQQLLLEDGIAADDNPTDSTPTKELIEKAVATLASQRAAMSSANSKKPPAGALRRGYASEGERDGLPSPPSPEARPLISSVLPPSPNTYETLASSATPTALPPLPPLPSGVPGVDSRGVPTHLAAAIDTTALLLARSSAEAVAAEAAKAGGQSGGSGSGRSGALDLAALSPLASAAAAAIEDAPSATAAAVHAAEAEFAAAQAAARREDGKEREDMGRLRSTASEPLLTVVAMNEDESKAVESAATIAGGPGESLIGDEVDVADMDVSGDTRLEAEAGTTTALEDAIMQRAIADGSHTQISRELPQELVDDGVVAALVSLEATVTLIREVADIPEPSQEQPSAVVLQPLLENEKVEEGPGQLAGGELLHEKTGEEETTSEAAHQQVEASDEVMSLLEKEGGRQDLSEEAESSSTVIVKEQEPSQKLKEQELIPSSESQQSQQSEDQLVPVGESSLQATRESEPSANGQVQQAFIDEPSSVEVREAAVSEPKAPPEVDQLEQESASLQESSAGLQREVNSAREQDGAAEDAAPGIVSVPEPTEALSAEEVQVDRSVEQDLPQHIAEEVASDGAPDERRGEVTAPEQKKEEETEVASRQDELREARQQHGEAGNAKVADAEMADAEAAAGDAEVTHAEAVNAVMADAEGARGGVPSGEASLSHAETAQSVQQEQDGGQEGLEQPDSESPALPAQEGTAHVEGGQTVAQQPVVESLQEMSGSQGQQEQQGEAEGQQEHEQAKELQPEQQSLETSLPTEHLPGNQEVTGETRGVEETTGAEETAPGTDTLAEVQASPSDDKAVEADEATTSVNQQQLPSEAERREPESQLQPDAASKEPVLDGQARGLADGQLPESLLQEQEVVPKEGQSEQVAEQSTGEVEQKAAELREQSSEPLLDDLPGQGQGEEGRMTEQEVRLTELLKEAVPAESTDIAENKALTPSNGQLVVFDEASKEQQLQQQDSPEPAAASKSAQLASAPSSDTVVPPDPNPPFPGLELSLCRHLLSQHMGVDAAEKAFEDHKVSKETFLRAPHTIVGNDKLVIRVENRYYPWVAAAPGLLAMLAYGHVLPPFLPSPSGGSIDVEKPQQKLPLPAQYNQELVLRTGWSYWLFGGGRKAANNNRTAGQGAPAAEQAGSGTGGGVGMVARVAASLGGGGGPGAQMAALRSEMMLAAAETALTDPLTRQMLYGMENFYHRPRKHRVRMSVPSAEQLASLPLQLGKNRICFYFFSQVLGKQQVECSLYVWKWNARVVISDVDGTITKSDVLGHVMPLVGRDWTQPGVVHLYSAIKENGYQMMFLSARAITQAHTTRNFLFGIKQDGTSMPEGPVVISPDGLFPSLYREVIRRRPHEFKIAVLTDILNLFPPTSNPFYAGFGNRETDEISYEAVGIPRGKIFTINPKGEVAVASMVESKSYMSLHTLVHDIFPAVDKTTDDHLAREDYNNWNFWKMPMPEIDDDDELSRLDPKKKKTSTSGSWGGSPPTDNKKALAIRRVHTTS